MGDFVVSVYVDLPVSFDDDYEPSDAEFEQAVQDAIGHTGATVEGFILATEVSP